MRREDNHVDKLIFRILAIPREIPMIGYAVLGTNDLARAASFYDALLAEMGVTRMMKFGERGYAWAAATDKPMLCIMKPYNGQLATVGNGVMVGIAADSRDQVDRIYKKAVELGGSGASSCLTRRSIGRRRAMRSGSLASLGPNA